MVGLSRENKVPSSRYQGFRQPLESIRLSLTLCSAIRPFVYSASGRLDFLAIGRALAEVELGKVPASRPVIMNVSISLGRITADP
jgi:hypothetical protein